LLLLLVAVKTSPVEEVLARLAGETHGVVSRRDVLMHGVTRHEIEQRLQTGLLLPVYRGVYRVGHGSPSVEAKYMAAVLAGGHGALLCGLAAAHLLGIVRGKPPPPEIVTRWMRSVAGLETRRGNRDSTIWKGIPVTSPAETLIDIAPDLSAEELARACHEAGVRHYTKPRQVKAALAQRPRTAGAGKLWAVMSGEVRVALSRLERGFHDLLESGDLPPPPETNRRAGTKRVDCRWPEHKLTVELDSFTYHNSTYAWEQDRQREREARDRGDEFRRYTWKDVFALRGRTLEDMQRLLG
jgi:hypothetical protein